MGDFFNLEKINYICSYILWFFVGNFYFNLCNIPLILYFLFFGIRNIFSSLTLFLLCLLPAGASFTALLSVMGKLLRNKEVSITKDYFSSYKKNFVQSSLLWALQLALFLMFYVNIEFFKKLDLGYLLMPFFYVAMLLLFSISMYIYPLISRFNLKNIDALKISLVLCISKPGITLGNIIVLLFSLMLIEIKLSYAVLFVASIFCFILMFFQKNLLKDLEERQK